MRPNVYLQTPTATIWHGDSIATMRELPDNSIDSIITDPPYGLGFMGKAWDALPPGEEWARECLRVLKPGGHLLAFGGTRTWHRLAVAVEDAGFEIRDSIAWMYGSGFPKSLDVSKAIDKANGKHDRDLTPFGAYVRACREAKGLTQRQVDDAMGTNTAASWWEGRKSGVQPPGPAVYARLKELLGMDDRYDELIEWLEAEREVVGQQTGGIHSAFEYVKPGGISGKSATFDLTAPATDAAKQWEGWGTALKPAFEPVVMARKPLVGTVAANVLEHGTGALNIDASRIGWQSEADKAAGRPASFAKAHDGFGDAFAIADRSHRDPEAEQPAAGRWPANVVLDETTAPLLDEQSGIFKGGASRFFYVAKAPKKERPVVDGVAHPTVKPLTLMQWLIKLVTPAGGVVLDPFEGSGTTLEACLIEGYRHIGIEREADYLPLIAARLERQDGALPAAA